MKMCEYCWEMVDDRVRECPNCHKFQFVQAPSKSAKPSLDVNKDSRNQPMGIFGKLFGKKTMVEQKTTNLNEENVKDYVEVQNNWGFGGNRSFLVEKHPNLNRILGDPSSSPPQHMDKETEDYWKNSGQRSSDAHKTLLSMSYLTHPDPKVRLRAIDLAKSIRTAGVENVFEKLLKSDPSNEVRNAVAKAIWERKFYPSSRDMLRNQGFVFEVDKTESKQCARCQRPLITLSEYKTQLTHYGFELGEDFHGNDVIRPTGWKGSREEAQTIMRNLMVKKGYRCSSCGKVFCEGCIVRYALPHPSTGGKGCLSCGGAFTVLE